MEIQKLHVINKTKCLILEIVKNNQKLDFFWQKKQKSQILFRMDTHKKSYSWWSISKIEWERKKSTKLSDYY